MRNGLPQLCRLFLGTWFLACFLISCSDATGGCDGVPEQLAAIMKNAEAPVETLNGPVALVAAVGPETAVSGAETLETQPDGTDGDVAHGVAREVFACWADER